VRVVQRVAAELNSANDNAIMAILEMLDAKLTTNTGSRPAMEIPVPPYRIALISVSAVQLAEVAQ